MAKAERSYLVPCECSARTPVSAGQAGGRIVCQGCGRSLDVPRLRDLAPFAVETVASTGVDRPAPGRGMLVGGTVVAILAAAVAATLVPVGGSFFPQPPRPEVIRSAIAAAPLSDIQLAWQSLAATGVHRPPTAEERRLEQFATHASGVTVLLWGVAAIAAAVAMAGFVRRVTSRPARGDRAG